MHGDLFDGLSNMLGPLDEEARERLRALIRKPSGVSWENSYSIMISARGHITLWQAVVAVDPTFPRSFRLNSESTAEFERIPSRELILAALQYARYMRD